MFTINPKTMVAVGALAAAILTTAVLSSGVAAAAPHDPHPQVFVEKNDNGGGVHQHKDNPA